MLALRCNVWGEMQEAIVEGVQIMLAATTAILKKSAGGHGGGLLMPERSQDNLTGPETNA